VLLLAFNLWATLAMAGETRPAPVKPVTASVAVVQQKGTTPQPGVALPLAVAVKAPTGKNPLPAKPPVVAPGSAKVIPAAAVGNPAAKMAAVPAPALTAPALPQTASSPKEVQAAVGKAEPPGPGKKHRRAAAPKRCEPQSLTYARQRSGIMTCRNGRENGPMTWFTAEKKAGRTSAEPAAGSVLILKGQGHGMPTGHVAYVEEVFPESPTTYRLIFSHTNYDRQCHLETKIEAFYDRGAMTMDVHTGAWRAWGHGLKVAGFILDSEAVADAPAVSGSAGQASLGRLEVSTPNGHGKL